jgi:hypothetical protein
MAMQELQDVFQYLLSDRFEPETLQRIKLEAWQQIKYSIRRFAQELQVYHGYSPDYAAKVAEQIVPKPILYSMIIEYRIRGQCLLPDFEHSPPGQEEAYRSLQYELLGPVFIAFLFDQTVDDFNLGRWEDTLIEREVQCAAEHLPVQADYYQQQIAAILDLCYQHKTACPPIHHIPQSLLPYWALAPHICWLAQAGISRDEIGDMLYTVGDSLTHEHLAQLTHLPDRRRYARPLDFIDQISGMLGANKYDSTARALARAILRGQGYLIVSSIQYLFYQLDFYYDPELQRYIGKRRQEKPHTTVRQMIQRFPAMINLMRLYELIVRVGDDAGDLLLDQERNAPNWVNFDHEGLDAFMAMSCLYDVEDENMRDFIAAMLRQLASEMSSTSDQHERFMTARHLSTRLLELVQVLLLLTFSTTTDLLTMIESEAEQAPQLVEDARTFIGIMHEVVFGSLVNAQFNDAYAEEVGADVSSSTVA